MAKVSETGPGPAGRGPRRLLARVRMWAGLVLLVPTVAHAGSTTVSFVHPDPSSVSEFRVLVGTKPGQYATTVPVGIPPRNGIAFSASVPIPDGVDVYLAVVAVDAWGQVSPPSNERVRRATPGSAALGAPGQPVPAPAK